MIIGAILTGGQSRRFGSDKALSSLGEDPSTGSPVLMGQRLVSELRRAGCDPVVAVGGTAGHSLGIPVVQDRYPDQGPLAGLASLLSWAGTGRVLVVPCDLPLIRAEDVSQLLIETDGTHNPAGAVIALDNGTPQPTVGCWPAESASALLGLVRSGERRLRAAFDVVPWTGVELDPTVLCDADDPATLKRLIRGPEGP